MSGCSLTLHEGGAAGTKKAAFLENSRSKGRCFRNRKAMIDPAARRSLTVLSGADVDVFFNYVTSAESPLTRPFARYRNPIYWSDGNMLNTLGSTQGIPSSAGILTMFRRSPIQ